MIYFIIQHIVCEFYMNLCFMHSMNRHLLNFIYIKSEQAVGSSQRVKMSVYLQPTKRVYTRRIDISGRYVTESIEIDGLHFALPLFNFCFFLGDSVIP